MGKRFWMTFVAVYVVYQVLGYLIHQVWLAPTYAATASLWRPEAEMQSKMWIMFVTSAVWSFVFTFIFARGYEGKGVGEGVRYGLLIGLFTALPMAYDNYVVLPIPYELALKWFLAGTAASIVLGIVASLIYRRD